ncbi:SDR family oxidoreductase [Rubellimicrobium sp. CFH 75288]|uniref:SDR family oxidoreductase n=1 Tax=Rubellimicrobium sp. CFH 75288 TaxID=2697034 RepID=UPI0014132870|nr:SDR family oxidoreductase [Rubellimicrobium sp. CFH 75288]NAZ36217.1 SDR family NAD(P)-dependent oxidoreductase [Rubellimicrobium sp. CFH 75288]
MPKEPQSGSVIVTGASAGIGRAVAVEFARHGWSVGLMARGRAGLEGAAAEVEAAGGRAFVLQADVADAAAVRLGADRFAQRFSRIDVWINAAMVTVLSPVSRLSPEEVRRVTEVTYLGQVHGILAALAHMRPRDRGTLVSIGSALAYRGIPLQAPYCAAKFATRGFLDSLRAELLAEGSRIRVTEVHLPAVNTPQFDWARNRMPRRPQPVPPIVEPEAVAPHVWRAALEAPRELWLGGSAARAIMGSTAAPGLTDRFLARQGARSQQDDLPARSRPDNLFAPLDEARDYGTRGRFGGMSSGHVSAIDPARLRAAALAGGVGLAAGLAAALAGRGRRGSGGG